LLLALCNSAYAQQPKKIHRIGYLSAQTPARDSGRFEAIRLALQELGHIEGQNIRFEYRYAEGKRNHDSELAAELVHLKVDVIIAAGGDTLTRAVKNATKAIPIVMTGTGADPVEAGHVASRLRR
jgi:putative tryptophan/tyrosine transport system substrate-binding protein